MGGISIKKSGGRRLKFLLVLSPLLLAIACSDETLSLFFDIPPPSPAEVAAAEREKAAAEVKAKAAEAAKAGGPGVAAAAQKAKEAAERPAIESVKTWEEAEKLLPKSPIDDAVDWMAALRQGTIKPRAAIDGPGNPEANAFKWDFYFPGPDPSLDAYFPHSSHTQWVACESCHPRIFRTRELEITMEQFVEGQYCGVCHGKVAFSLDSCARCHTAQAE